ncbi:MAG: LytR/AlgR family response regulator transcription factor [Luteibaculaceae bacterium]
MRVILIDDERLARKELAKMLENYPDVTIIGEASNADEAIALIEQEKPDLIFCDIQMPEKTGFDLIEELHYLPRVIFVTAYDEYAIKAFSVNAADYLLKPLEPQRLESSLEKIRQQLKEEKNLEPAPQADARKHLAIQDKIFLKDGDKCWFISLSDIRLLESEGNYVRVYFQTFKPLILRSLNSLEEKLDDKHFFRASRKFIINLNCIVKVENWFSGGLIAELTSGEKIEISRRQAVKFKEVFSL